MFESDGFLNVALSSELNNKPKLLGATSTSKGKVFVQGLFANSQTKRIFVEHGYEIVNRLEDADVVVWTGGEDINPRIYNEKPAGAVGWSDRRDKEDLDAVTKSVGKFKVGICRGAQLLNCYPNGGALWQDVNNHGGYHKIKDHVTQEEVVVNSLHHQQMKLTNQAELVASCNISTEKDCYVSAWRAGSQTNDDVEVAFYPNTQSLLFQGHPEFGHSGTTEYFFRLMERYWLAA